jgi:hypothetical protein
LRPRFAFPIAQRVLALSGEIDGLAENPRCLLRRVEAGGVFRLDEIQVELRLALETLRGCEFFLGLARSFRRFEIPDQIHQGIHHHIAQFVSALLNRLDPRRELFFGPLVAGLASAIDVEHRAAHVVVALRPSPGIRKRVDPNAKRYTDSYSDQHALNHASVHLAYRSRDASDATVARRIDTAPLFMVPLLSRAHTG